MLRAVFLLLAAVFSVLAEDNLLIRPGDIWRYQPVSTNSVEPRPGWTALNYDDSTWLSGIASFTTPVACCNPGAAEATLLPATNSTICFRKTFQVIDPSFVRWLTLQIDYESGFVAYLNGTEVARRSFPAGPNPVPLDAIASNHARYSFPTEWIDVSAWIGLLRPGTNVLAIQLHSAGSVNPNMRVIAELQANFTRGPFIENTTTNSTQVIWRTQNPTTGFILYGKDTNHLSAAVANDLANIHALTLSNLEPNQEYVYRVFADSGNTAALSDFATFRTFKMPGAPVSFIVMGDSGQASLGQYKIAQRMKETPAELLMHVGDIVYPGFHAWYVDNRCFSVYHDQMKSVPYFFCLGNHDEYGEADYLASFYLPTNSVYHNECFYSFDHGSVHFVVLATDTAAGHRYDPDSLQYKWLEADLQATKQPWKFLFFHHVIRSSSVHTTDDYLFDGTYDKYQLQATIGVLAERYGAQIIFNGHDHDFERFAPFRGMTSIISGGGGASLYSQVYDSKTGKLFLEEGSMQYYTRHNFLRVNVTGPQLTVEVVDDNGVVFDRFYRSQVGGGPAAYASAWATPQIETTAGNDSDGNTLGQTFDFPDAGIPTFAGLDANLGRAHVRNDRDFLYVGLESVCLHDFQAVALFIENTANPGVSFLGNLGNHQIDPDAQGADGLDLLPLTFKNFRPSIGCLLGDELADGTFRSFKRPGMSWATGQGVFQLQSGFPNVPGARLQQFNRSPQTAAVPAPESNADFIEVAIPWSALGVSTGLVRIGAVVLGSLNSSSNAALLDTAFLGQSLTPGDTSIFLEPISVQLAPDPNPNADSFGFRGVIVAPRVVRFTWNSINNATYRLQSTTALGIPFQDLTAPGLPIVATGAQTTYDLNLDSVSAPRFFRLQSN